jgi:hypothetical protein
MCDDGQIWLAASDQVGGDTALLLINASMWLSRRASVLAQREGRTSLLIVPISTRAAHTDLLDDVACAVKMSVIISRRKLRADELTCSTSTRLRYPH